MAAGTVAVTALVVSGCGLSLQSMPKIGSGGPPSYELHARFANVLNLPADAQVREGSAVIGQVSSITTAKFAADLTLQIHDGVRLPVGTTAQVRFDSPLGDEYVVVQPPVGAAPSPPLAPGTLLTEATTSTAPTVEDTLTALGAVLNGGGINQLQTIVSEFNLTLSGHQPQIRQLLVQISAAVSSLAKHTGSIDGALAAIGSLSAELNQGSGTIVAGIDAIGPSVTVLARENGDLDQLLTNLGQLSAVSNRIIATSGQASVTDARNLLPVVNQLVGVEQQLAPDLNAIAAFERSTPKIAPGNYLQVALTLHANFPSTPITATAASTSRSQATGTPPGSGPTGAGLTGAALPAASGAAPASGVAPASGTQAVSSLLRAALP